MYIRTWWVEFEHVSRFLEPDYLHEYLGISEDLCFLLHNLHSDVRAIEKLSPVEGECRRGATRLVTPSRCLLADGDFHVVDHSDGRTYTSRSGELQPSHLPHAQIFTFPAFSSRLNLMIQKMAPPSRHAAASAVPRGIYCPTITFFKNDADQDLDLDRQSEHIRFLLQSGIHGIVVHGTTGESVLLSHEERNTITGLTAKTRHEVGANHVALVVGCPAQSTREVLKMCRDAKEHGGDFALVLPPSYWTAAVTPAVIEGFYREVADKSPLPIIIYSFPAVTAGIDMNSDLLARLAQHPVSHQPQTSLHICTFHHSPLTHMDRPRTSKAPN